MMAMIKKILAMKHILLLDALLIAACVWLGVRFYAQWQAMAAANQVSNIVAPSAAMKNVLDKQKSPDTLQKNYMVIATRNLFSPDRNDQISKDDAAKSRPPKPILFGVLHLKDATLAMMSPPDSREFHSLKVGDKIGEYTLTRILVNKVELKWGNETVEASTDEQPKPIAPPLSTAAGNAGSIESKVVSVASSGSGSTSGSAAGSSVAPPPTPQNPGACKGRWVKTLFGQSCVEDGK